MNGFQRVNKPVLKKITHTNYNNPSLNSIGMQGVFYTARSPPLIRDQLLYKNPAFRDSLEQELQQGTHNKYQQKVEQQKSLNRAQTSPVTSPNNLNPNVSRLLPRKNEVLQKVTHIPMQVAYDRYSNYNNTTAIKHKQLIGYNIISNF